MKYSVILTTYDPNATTQITRPGARSVLRLTRQKELGIQVKHSLAGETKWFGEILKCMTCRDELKVSRYDEININRMQPGPIKADGRTMRVTGKSRIDGFKMI